MKDFDEEDEHHCIIEFIKGYGGFLPFCKYDWDCGQFVDMETVEVIGNIYQDKNLLK